MEVYRSGHNGPDSKSGIRQRIVGSNPTASANKKGVLLHSFFIARWGSNMELANLFAYAVGKNSTGYCFVGRSHRRESHRFRQ